MSNKIKLNILAFSTVLLWATAFPLTKVIGTEISPQSLGFIRCASAAVLLIIIGKATHIRKPQCRKHIPFFLAAGLTGFALYLIFFTMGIGTLTSATSSVIIALTPVMTAIGASFIYNEKIHAAGWLCIAAAFAGVLVLLLWNGVLSINIGIVWTIIAAILFCGYNLINRKLSSMGYSAPEIVTYAIICGSVILALFAPQAVTEIRHASMQSILAALYLGLMPSATAYMLWSKAIGYAEKTSEVTNYMFITPLLSAILGFIILNEVPDMGTLIGGIIIIASVIGFNIKS